MKIAYLSPTFPPILGGMGTACYYTANEVGKSHEVTVFLPVRHSPDSTCFCRDKGGADWVEYQKGNYQIKLIRPWLSYGHGHLMPQVLWLLKNFDIVHLYYPYFGVAEFLWLLKIWHKIKPKIIFHHAMGAVGEGWLKYFFRFHTKFIMPILMISADMIFILTTDYAEHSDISPIYQKYPEKFKVVPHGVDLNKFQSRIKCGTNFKFQIDLKNKLGIKDDLVVFTAQALDKQHYFKGIDILIKSIHLLITRLPRPFGHELKAEWAKSRGYSLPVTFIVAGDGNLKKYYQNLTQKLNIADKVIFLGQVSHNELPNYYNLADITVVPSTARTECFSITAIESMACGIPVIVSDWPGLRVTIENNKTGLIVKPGDEKDLVEKIKYLYNNPEKLKEMGENARKRVEERYDWKIIIQQIIGHYNEISRPLNSKSKAQNSK